MSDRPVAGPRRFGVFRIGPDTIAVDAEVLAEVAAIDRLERLPSPSPAVLGALDVRGLTVPVLDIGKLAGLADLEVKGGVAVVCAHQGRLLALAVDAVAGLAEVGAVDIEVPRGVGPVADAAPLMVGVFRHGGTLVSVIDPRPAFARADIPAGAARRNTASGPLTGRGAPGGQVGAAAPHLVFETGGVLYAIDAVAVSATVPRQPIAGEALRSGLSLGTIRHLGRRVPVVDLNRVTELGAANDPAEAETVVLRLPEGRVLGFAVDHIRRIQQVPASALRPVPASLARANPFLASTIGEAGTQVFVLNAAALCADPQLGELAALSEQPDDGAPADKARDATVAGAASAAPPAAADDGEVIAERRRYLVFETGGGEGVVPVEEIGRVIPRPERLTPAARRSGLLGYFELDGAAVPLACLADLVGRAANPEAAEDRVMVTGEGTERVGFLVDRVASIKTSSWYRPGTGAPGAPEGLVGFGTGPGTRVLPRFALAPMRAALGATDRS